MKQLSFLSKRPESVRFFTPLDNVLFGVTVTSLKEVGRIQALLENFQGGHRHVTFESLFDHSGLYKGRPAPHPGSNSHGSGIAPGFLPGIGGSKVWKSELKTES